MYTRLECSCFFMGHSRWHGQRAHSVFIFVHVLSVMVRVNLVAVALAIITLASNYFLGLNTHIHKQEAARAHRRHWGHRGQISHIILALSNWILHAHSLISYMSTSRQDQTFFFGNFYFYCAYFITLYILFIYIFETHPTNKEKRKIRPSL